MSLWDQTQVYHQSVWNASYICTKWYFYFHFLVFQRYKFLNIIAYFSDILETALHAILFEVFIPMFSKENSCIFFLLFHVLKHGFTILWKFSPVKENFHWNFSFHSLMLLFQCYFCSSNTGVLGQLPL